jgi:hypothetical protein
MVRAVACRRRLITITSHAGKPSYGTFTWTELEAPSSLLIVAETEAMLLTGVGSAAELWNVNEIAVVNWPPKACEAVLLNQAAATCCMSMGN